MCAARAPSRGFPPPPPSRSGPGCGGAGLSSALVGLALLSAPHFPPSHLPFLSPGLPPTQADCHSRILLPGQGDLWGEGPATRSGPGSSSTHHPSPAWETGWRGPGPESPLSPCLPPKGKSAPSSCPFFTGLTPSQADFSKIQIPAHWAPTWSN